MANKTKLPKSRFRGSVFIKAAELMSVEGSEYGQFGACKAIAGAQKTRSFASQYESRAHKFFDAVFKPKACLVSHYFGDYESTSGGSTRNQRNKVKRNRKHRVLALLLAAELRNAGFTTGDFK